MTCAACVSHVESALKGVPGVTRVSVNLATEQAAVDLETSSLPLEQLRKAVAGAGYKVPTHRASLDIQGMTCAACVSHVENALRGVSGVAVAQVNLATEKANVEYLPGVADLGAFKEAVQKAGYRVEGADSETLDTQGQMERLAKVQEIRALRNPGGIGHRRRNSSIPGYLRCLTLGAGTNEQGILPVPALGIGHASAVLGRMELLHIGSGRAAPPHIKHAHPHCPGHNHRLWIQRSGAAAGCPGGAPVSGRPWY